MVPPSPPVVTAFGRGPGERARLARLVEMGAVAAEGLSVTPEYAAAVALAAALHDPAFLSTATWAVAWHQRPGEMPEFVAASSDGSWLPQGVWLPVGVTLAHHDPAIDPAVRASWEFLPPERVLASHARLLGSVPHVVVVRSVTPGTAARWPRSTVVVAVGAEPPPSPNPLADHTIGRRHRLAVLSPDAWWPVVCALPEDQVAGAVRQVAAAVASAQAGAGGADADRLRAAAVGQVGRAPSPDLAAALAEAVVQARVAVMLAAQGEPPATPPPHWNAGLRRAAAELRAWEALSLAAAPGPADRMRLAEVVTAASAAGLVTGDEGAAA